MSDPVSAAFWHPPWYPNQDEHHNPWSVPAVVTGKTHYAIWVDSLKPGELLALIEKHRRTTEVKPDA